MARGRAVQHVAFPRVSWDCLPSFALSVRLRLVIIAKTTQTRVAEFKRDGSNYAKQLKGQAIVAAQLQTPHHQGALVVLAL